MIKLIKKIISLAFSLLIIVVILGAVTQLAIAPSPEKVEEKLEQTDGYSVSWSDGNDAKSLAMLMGIDNCTAMAIIVDGTEVDGILDLDDTKGATILYFDSYEDMYEAYKKLKDDNDNDSTAVQFRGKSVLVGNADVIMAYRTKVLF